MKDYIVDYQLIMGSGVFRHTENYVKTYRVNHALTAKQLCEIEIQKGIAESFNENVKMEYKILGVRESY